MPKKNRVNVEIWKGKKRIVARSVDGKIQTWKKFDRKVTIRKLRQVFKNNNTLNIDIEKNTLKTKPYSEFVDNSLTKPRKKTQPFLIQASVRIKKEIVTASSRHMRWANTGIPKREATSRLYERVSHTISEDVYDAKTGLKFLFERNMISQIEYRLVYYA